MLYHPIYNNKNDSVTINIISCFKHNYEAEQLTTTEVNKLSRSPIICYLLRELAVLLGRPAALCVFRLHKRPL